MYRRLFPCLSVGLSQWGWGCSFLWVHLQVPPLVGYVVVSANSNAIGKSAVTAVDVVVRVVIVVKVVVVIVAVVVVSVSSSLLGFPFLCLFSLPVLSVH